MSIEQPNYGLSTDVTLGGENASDIISPSQKAIKAYVDANSGGGSLSDLEDVSISSATSGQVLGYNGTSWTNTAMTTVTFRDWSVS